MRSAWRLFLLLPATLLLAQQPPECFDPPNPSPPRDLPLCGNGQLDPGEVCDDGNQINFDGCNAFCSAFDAMPAAATLAGGMTTCPGGKKPLIGAQMAQQFCNLRAIDTALDGSYVILADRGTLLRFDLFVTQQKNSIRELQASVDRAFSDNICSVAVLRPDSAIMLHDCGTQQLFIATGDTGAHVQLLADWGGYFRPTASNFKAYYDKTRRLAVVAGLIDGGAMLLGVQLVNVSSSSASDVIVTAATTQLAEIPRIVYNVWDSMGTKRPSMDLSSMEPRAVLHDPCPATFRALQMCYVLYLEDTTHMDFMRVYIPDSGGLDMEYYADTNKNDNALGHPLVRSSGPLLYTLRGACLQIESRILTDEGKTPPTITLGNACKQAPRLGLKCATPFNNPFITDVITSPILLPEGLSVTHTHLELAHIFAAQCPGQANRTGSPALYRSVLRSIYADTLPVDYVELAGLMDIIYITPTSVGLISTKRIALYDRARPGYVRATNLIHCPKGFFGEVGGACAPCKGAAFAAGARIPVAYQIQCDDSTAFETFTVVTSKNVSAEDVQRGICSYTAAKNGTCASDVSLASPQPFNMAADALDAAQPPPPEALIPCLIADAERTTGRTIARQNAAEYNARVVSRGQHILAAAAKPVLAEYLADDAAAKSCRSTLVRGVGSFIQCALPRASSSPAARRLLQSAPSSSSLIEHQGPVYASTSPISWDLRSDGSATPANTVLGPPSKNGSSGDEGLPLWALILIISAASAVALTLVAYAVCHRSMLRRFARK